MVGEWKCAKSATLHISWQAQHFRKVRYRFRGRPGTDFKAGAAALSQGQVQIVRQVQHSRGRVQISWQAQHFRKVKHEVAALRKKGQPQLSGFQKRCTHAGKNPTPNRHGQNQRGVRKGCLSFDPRSNVHPSRSNNASQPL